MARNIQSLILTDLSDGENEKKTEETCFETCFVKILLIFTYLHKTQQGQKTAGNFAIVLRNLLAKCLGI